MTALCVLIAVTVWIGITPQAAFAQESPAPAVAAPERAAFGSQGLTVSIASIAFPNECSGYCNARMQLILKNTKSTPIDIAAIKFARATTANGLEFIISDINSMSSCGVNESTSELDQTRFCLQNMGMQDYTTIAPDEIAPLQIKFDRQGCCAAINMDTTITFTLRFLVRPSASADPLAPSDASKTKPSVVAINFPLVPLK